MRQRSVLVALYKNSPPHIACVEGGVAGATNPRPYPPRQHVASPFQIHSLRDGRARRRPKNTPHGERGDRGPSRASSQERITMRWHQPASGNGAALAGPPGNGKREEVTEAPRRLVRTRPTRQRCTPATPRSRPPPRHEACKRRNGNQLARSRAAIQADLLRLCSLEPLDSPLLLCAHRRLGLVHCHCELDGIRRRLRSQVVHACLQAQLPPVEVHRGQLRRRCIHHMNVDGLGLVDVHASVRRQI
mmetsp:Transcript_72695/g.210456  ORF Transcript_72695/g.210456 Transcript_72695/m.210456 type:complete len:246 (+) Transcript_72695:114-851(+)